uniref:CHK kinase-like domain-containing protein n=1 Tax=Heliothis virescens TaxID=7102 RepID=A0A2A4K7V6_HELVI
MQVETLPEIYPTEKKYICPNKVANNLDKSINSIIAKSGFIKYDVEKIPLSTNGGNYLGLLHEINIKGETKEGFKELNIFVKSIIPGESDFQILSVSDVYQIEVFAYKEFLKIIDELQEEAQVPLEERYKIVKCYDESNSEYVIMENIAKKGFTTGHRCDVVSLKFAELAMQELAKFHAFSFVLQEKRPEFFEQKIKTLKTPYSFCEQFYQMAVSTSKMTMNNIDDEDAKARLGKFCEGMVERYEKHFTDETKKICLCHGDYRPNNILMNMTDGEVRSTKTDIIPVDYQLMNYGCPVLDIFYFIYISTDRAFRQAHLTHLKDLYHETMTKFLKYFDIDVNLYYSKDQFEKDYKDKLDYGLSLSIMYLPFMLVSEDDIPDVTKTDMTDINFKLHDVFKDRMKGVIEDYVEWGIL